MAAAAVARCDAILQDPAAHEALKSMAAIDREGVLGLAGDMYNMQQDVQRMSAAVARMEGNIQLLAQQILHTKNQEIGTGHKGILDSKAVLSLKPMGSKGNFKEWNEKFVNAMAQAVEGSRDCIKAMMNSSDPDSTEEWDQESWDEQFKTKELKWDRMNEVMYCVLIDKCEGEALTRVRSAGQGQGIKAYMSLYRWFAGTTGLGAAGKVSKVMNPTPPKKEEEIADAIDRWCEAQRQIEEVDMDLRLKPMLNMAALKVMMVGKAKDFSSTSRAQCPAVRLKRKLRKCSKGATSMPSADALT